MLNKLGIIAACLCILYLSSIQAVEPVLIPTPPPGGFCPARRDEVVAMLKHVLARAEDAPNLQSRIRTVLERLQ